MKLSVPLLTSVLLLTGAVALQTGCASTQTRQSTGEMVDDAAITTKVKAAFVRDPLVKALDVSVDTFKGTVQLSGFVNSAEEKSKAEQIARTVSGVTNVQNNITVK
jgi:osmotically-inducible protein OsmY